MTVWTPGASRDMLNGGDGNDRVYGEAGDDIVDLGLGMTSSTPASATTP